MSNLIFVLQIKRPRSRGAVLKKNMHISKIPVYTRFAENVQITSKLKSTQELYVAPKSRAEKDESMRH